MKSDNYYTYRLPSFDADNPASSIDSFLKDQSDEDSSDQSSEKDTQQDPSTGTGNSFTPPFSVRNRMEREMMRNKLAGRPCPFVDSNSHCSALSIRCSDREQFAYPESREQRNMPHKCFYIPDHWGENVLILEKDPLIARFCGTILELFFDIPRDNISVVATGRDALDTLKEYKLHEKRCGLFVCSINLSDMSGISVLEELWERNYYTDVLLTWDESVSRLPVDEQKKLRHMIKTQDIIKAVLMKPFHSDSFFEAVRSTKRRMNTINRKTSSSH